MKRLLTFFAASCIFSAPAFAGSDSSKKAVVPVEDDRWKFQLSVPGWMAGMEGDVGINGLTSAVKIDPGGILRRVDMTASLRGEASKGRFGVLGDFLYLSLSDGIGTETAVQKVDLQMDQIMGELAARWRLVEGRRGFLDVIGGVRYTNLFQQAVVQADAQQVAEASDTLVNAISNRLATALAGEALRNLAANAFSTRAEGLDPSQPSNLPIGPLGGTVGAQLRAKVDRIVAAKQAGLRAAVQTAQQASGIARIAANARAESLKKDLSREIADTVEKTLNTRIARTDDWFDPFIGLRGRFNFTDPIYCTARGDVGGFGVGADFTWQASAAFGVQLTERVFAEAGYRILEVDYRHDGLIYDVRTHGAEINLGIVF